MGACGSTNADADAEAAKEEQDQKGEAEDSPKSSPRAKDKGEKDGDFDFRETLRGVTCAVLEKLATSLEYESEALQEIAVNAGHAHYVDLLAPQYFEKALRDALDMKRVPEREPDCERSNLAYEQQKFANFVVAAAAAPFRSPPPSRREFAKRMQNAALKTQEALKSSAAQTTNADLKKDLGFFSRAFNFMQGDIASDGSQLLYQNIDKMCEVE